MQKIIQFIKSNNAFVIILGLIFASAAGALANEKSREAIVGKTVITRTGMDNTQIISADLENFDIGLKIKSVKEDDKFYYVNFDYNAIDAKDGVWQTVKKEKNINVSKIRLGDMDLGLYLAEELKQLTEREMAYMKEVQSIEKSKGAQKQVESIEYTGLKGLVFNDETKEIAGYNPVKEKENQKAEVVGVFNPSSGEEDEENGQTTDEGEGKISPQVTVVKEVISKETIMQMVKEALAQEQVSEVSASSASSLPALPTGQAGSEAGLSSYQVTSSSSESSESSSSSLESSLESSSSSLEYSASSESSSQPSSETTAGEASSSSSSSSQAASPESSSSSSESSSSAESSASSSLENSSSTESSSSLPAEEASSSSVAI